ncbi:hypothetical protein Ga0100230_021070 [Opitutaceae bacterium TAV3]|nr:hypothetical protein Ga0100230_021070 [Opitutaceae bacterium TAV3]
MAGLTPFTHPRPSSPLPLRTLILTLLLIVISLLLILTEQPHARPCPTMNSTTPHHRQPARLMDDPNAKDTALIAAALIVIVGAALIVALIALLT